MTDETTQTLATPDLIKPVLPAHLQSSWPGFMDILHTARDVAIDEAHAHVKEQGVNRGAKVEAYQRITGGSPGESWCADFASWCMMVGLARRMGWNEDEESMLSHVGEFGRRYIPISGLCRTLWNEAEARGYGRDRHYHPDSGDLILFDYHQVGQPHHVGFVLQENKDGTIKSVEGNTSSGEGNGASQDNGDGVFVRVRKRWRIHGFIHGHKEV